MNGKIIIFEDQELISNSIRIILEKAMLLLNNSLKLRGCCVKNPEEIIFESVNLGLISNKENWLEAVYSMKYYVYDEFSEDRVVSFYLQIKTKYFPIFNDLYLSKK